MNLQREKCPAKINLSLDVVGTRNDGYHLLEMIMQTVDLNDYVTVEKTDADKEISLTCSTTGVPLTKENTVYKAAKKIMDAFSLDGGVRITLEKKIPMGAGLAGGSTDAAGVIRSMNKLYELNMSPEDMRKIAVEVGADVPYCIEGGTAYVEGIGEKITKLHPLKKTWCVIAKPEQSLSTKDIFTSLDDNGIVKHPDNKYLVRCIEEENVRALASGMVNVLEQVSIPRCPYIADIKDIMLQFDALGSMMTGSGSAVFGLFENEESAKLCYKRLRDYIKEAYLVATI